MDKSKKKRKKKVRLKMATATHTILGYTGTLGRAISARQRREPGYSKQQQARMIRAILSRRMMSPPSYEDVLDYVDSEVTYAENKREVLAVFGERSRRGQITSKDLQEMHCTSLHNKCASNGLETCQVACDECKNPAACKKADKIGKEIKKHGRELSHFERMQAEKLKEAKRVPKKAKYSTGQIVKARKDYESLCGFSGVSTVTQVKEYPDYVMYAVKGKPQGLVEEEWVVAVNGKALKPVLKEKDKTLTIRILTDDFATFMGDDGKIYYGDKLKKGAVVAVPMTQAERFIKQERAKRVKTKTKKSRSVVGQAPRALDPLTKVQTLPGLSTAPKKKSVYVMFKGVKKHRMRCPICGRAAIDNFCIVHSDVKALDLETSKKAQKLTAGLLKAQKDWEKTHPKRAKAQKEYEAALKERLEPRAVRVSKPVTIKPPKPTPAKVTKPSKKVKKHKPTKTAKTPKKRKTPLHLKTLTDAQIKHVRKHGYADVTIDGVKKRVTKRNYAPRKRTVQWYRSGGKVCLKVMRK